jgi:hypothetical protein
MNHQTAQNYKLGECPIIASCCMIMRQLWQIID